jgi:non-ribosomal peptide synthetase component F/aryl carrier-like protein
MSPLHFLEQPMRWLRAMDRVRATVSGGPNFAYDLCVRKSDPEQVAQLDLSSWQVAFNGAEPIRPETLQRFADAFTPSGFRADAFLPCYGLAEATLIVSATGGCSGSAGEPGSAVPPAVQVDRGALERHVAMRPTDGPAVRLASCGRGAPDQRIAIVDPTASTVCAAQQVGEIWVSGPSIAQGYWGKPDETDRVFGARIADRDEGPFLRTGDLGFLLEGELVVTGRLKDLIIVRGQNHYPQDIELTAERADPVLRPGCTAAFLIEEDGDDGRLVLVHEVRRQSGEVDVTRVAAEVRRVVAQEDGLQVHTVALIRAGGMPKTSSGKVQRRLCRVRFLSAELPEIGRCEATSRTPVGSAPPSAEQVISAAPERRAVLLEGYLRGQVAAVSGIGPGDLDRQQPLLAAGLDSLAVLQLKHRVETDLAVSLSLAAMLAGASLSEVVDQLAGQVGEPAPGGKGPAAPVGGTAEVAGPAAAERVAPMSYGQRWMWFVQQLEPESTAYTIAVALRLPNSVDFSALRRALDTLVSRHPILRTTFPVRNGEPVQLVHPSGQAGYQEHDAHDLDETALVQCLTSAARKPFDLESGPLLRLDMYRRPGGEVLLLSVHHIVTDYWSMTILARELGAYYTAYTGGRDPALPPPSATYLDVVEWQRSVLSDQALAGRLARYWDEQVGAGVPTLALPAVSQGRCTRGGSRYFSLSKTLTHRLRARAAAERVTLYVLLLATFQTLLHRYTGQDDLVVGAGAAARTRREFAEVVGCCTNPVMIRSRAAEGEPFRALLSRTQDQVIGALEHQDYPMILLAERHRVARRGRTLFETLFTFNRSPQHGDDLAALATVGQPGVRRSLGSLQVESFPLPPDESTLPLELVMAEVCDVPHGLLRYRADTLDESAADRLVEQFVAMLEMVAADPGMPIGELIPGKVQAGFRRS